MGLRLCVLCTYVHAMVMCYVPFSAITAALSGMLTVTRAIDLGKQHHASVQALAMSSCVAWIAMGMEACAVDEAADFRIGCYLL